MKNYYSLYLLVIAALYSSHITTSQAQENTKSMAVFSEVPGAAEIVAGNYSNAISQMHFAKSINPMLLFNNLCVAYTLSYQFSDARTHCGRAIKETKRHKNYGVTWLEQTRPYRLKRLYRERAREHLQILDSIESSTISNNVTRQRTGD